MSDPTEAELNARIDRLHGPGAAAALDAALADGSIFADHRPPSAQDEAETLAVEALGRILRPDLYRRRDRNRSLNLATMPTLSGDLVEVETTARAVLAAGYRSPAEVARLTQEAESRGFQSGARSQEPSEWHQQRLAEARAEAVNWLSTHEASVAVTDALTGAGVFMIRSRVREVLTAARSVLAARSVPVEQEAGE